MKKEYVIPAVCLLCACQMTVAKAEGFSLTQWSARGLSLAGGMVGRADDPSAIAYNAAGITRLPGTHVMVGYAAVTPESTFDLYEKDGSFSSTTTGAHILSAPYAYLTSICGWAWGSSRASALTMSFLTTGRGVTI